MNALDYLKHDHDSISLLFDQIMQAKGMMEKRRLFTEIKRSLTEHAHVEELSFYPVLLDQFREIVEAGFDEHQDIRILLDEIQSTREDEEFNDRIDDLIDQVEHHVEEEEKILFPKARTVFSEEELEDLGTRMEELRREFQEKVAA